jgi:serine protease Do
VRLSTGEVFDRVSFLDGDQAADVALVKVPGFRLRAAEVTESIPDIGTKVIALGSPLGLDHTVSEGIISALRVHDGRQVVQTTAPIERVKRGPAA